MKKEGMKHTTSKKISVALEMHLATHLIPSVIVVTLAQKFPTAFSIDLQHKRRRKENLLYMTKTVM